MPHLTYPTRQIFVLQRALGAFCSGVAAKHADSASDSDEMVKMEDETRIVGISTTGCGCRVMARMVGSSSLETATTAGFAPADEGIVDSSSLEPRITAGFAHADDVPTTLAASRPGFTFNSGVRKAGFALADKGMVGSLSLETESTAGFAPADDVPATLAASRPGSTFNSVFRKVSSASRTLGGVWMFSGWLTEPPPVSTTCSSTTGVPKGDGLDEVHMTLAAFGALTISSCPQDVSASLTCVSSL
ncbi:hypothetical protein R1sor_027273 [Riccia sorocarpa]|uniref:Secreted protein n=1 Tax=Riccia sorocarpa TaxID=122646 RepID=A0ABD3GDR6_9MARC